MGVGRPDALMAHQNGPTPLLNALTVDVEDYFHVSAFQASVQRSEWASYESRVCRNTERLLVIFEQAGVHATFFVLGWVAERFPQLVRDIARAGHELASHSHEHQLVYDLSPDAFRADLRQARDVIENAAGVRVCGYRAPSFSITSDSLWALDVLVEEGYRYDASIYPIRHDRYGIPDAPRHIHRLQRPGGALWEIPGGTIRRAGVNLPVGGGGYFRLLPYTVTRAALHSLNNVERQPAMVYLHPWEIDPGQPRIPASLTSRFRHYSNLSQTEKRLRRLLSDFRFGPIAEVLRERSEPDVQVH
jgi:polysaccharide deacetylase family protein (PEP-CTERM system associated)